MTESATLDETLCTTAERNVNRHKRRHSLIIEVIIVAVIEVIIVVIIEVIIVAIIEVI